MSALLGTPLNAPLVLMRRVFHGPDDTMPYVGEVTYRGDSVRFEMDLTP